MELFFDVWKNKIDTKRKKLFMTQPIISDSSGW